MYLNGRHDGIFSVTITEPEWRLHRDLNADVVLVFAATSIYNSCIPMADKTLLRLLDSMGTYEALVYDRRAAARGQQCLFRCQAPYTDMAFWIGQPAVPAARSVSLTEYDPVIQFPTEGIVAVLGLRGSGKTRHLLKTKTLPEETVVFCPFSDGAAQFDGLASTMHTDCCPDYFRDVFNRQRMLPAGSRLCVVFDDCFFGSKHALNSLNELYQHKDGAGVLSLACMQYPLAMDTACRDQLSLVIAFPGYMPAVLPMLKQYFNCFHTVGDLARVFQEGLGEQEALVFDPQAYKAGRPCLFYYKAPLTP